MGYSTSRVPRGESRRMHFAPCQGGKDAGETKDGKDAESYFQTPDKSRVYIHRDLDPPDEEVEKESDDPHAEDHTKLSHSRRRS